MYKFTYLQDTHTHTHTLAASFTMHTKATTITIHYNAMMGVFATCNTYTSL